MQKEEKELDLNFLLKLQELQSILEPQLEKQLISEQLLEQQ